jgi:long-subunit acyl-CoA synthetase (AMP-forming)
MVVVSLYDTLGPDAVSFILNQAEIPLVVCSKDKVSKVCLVSSALLCLSPERGSGVCLPG